MSDHVWGKSMYAQSVPSGAQVMSDLNWLLPGLSTVVACPHCKGQVDRKLIRNEDGQADTYDHIWRVHQHMAVSDIVVHLNDQCNWTREQVADWLDTLDVDLTFPTEPPSRPAPKLRRASACGCPDCSDAANDISSNGPTITFSTKDDFDAKYAKVSGTSYPKQTVSYAPADVEWTTKSYALWVDEADADDSVFNWTPIGNTSGPIIFLDAESKSGKETIETGLFKGMQFTVAIDPASVNDFFNGIMVAVTKVAKAYGKMATVMLDSLSKLQKFELGKYYVAQTPELAIPSLANPLPPDPQTVPFTASTLPSTNQLLSGFTVTASSIFPAGLPLPIAPNLVAPKSYPTAKEKFSHGKY